MWPAWLRRTAVAAVDEDSLRWCVVDVESSGLNIKQDRLLAIAGVVLQCRAGSANAAPVIVPHDSFEVVIAQSQASSHSNILLHGIGAGAQRAGVPLADALQAFAAWRGRSPLVAFHAPFDQAMINRHLRMAGLSKTLGELPASAWLDIAPLAQACLSEATPIQRRAAQGLDFWLARHQIACHPRHQAIIDAYAEAQLMQCLWRTLRQQCDGTADWRSLQRLAKLAKQLQ